MTSPSPIYQNMQDILLHKMFHSGVAICIDRVVFSPSRKQMRELFSRASSCLWLTSRSLARQTPISSLSNYVRTYVRRSLLPGSVCGLITRCMRARERGLLPSLLRPISERREGGLDGGESVCLSLCRTDCLRCGYHSAILLTAFPMQNFILPLRFAPGGFSQQGRPLTPPGPRPRDAAAAAAALMKRRFAF